MPFRFRRSFKVAPGVRLNVGKKGVSTSVGVRGAHVTVGHGKVRSTVGIPGTGLSYTTSTKKPPKQSKQSKQPKLTVQLIKPSQPANLQPGQSQPLLYLYTCVYCSHQFQTPGGLVVCPHCGR